MTIKLYELAGAEEKRRFSPYCWRVKMALAHKELPVETIPWRFTDKAAIAFSGQEKVPVIVDGDKTVYDSWAIANYLEVAYPERASLFGCPQAQAQTLFVKHWSEQVLAPALFPLIILDIVAHLHEKDQEYFRQTREKRVGKRLEDYASNQPERLLKFRSSLAPLRETFHSQAFIGGQTPTFADYLVFGWFQWARCISPLKLLAGDDSVYVWRQRMLDLYDGLAGKAVGYGV